MGRVSNMYYTLTKQEANKIIANVNGFDMTYGDYLDNIGQEYEIIDDKN